MSQSAELIPLIAELAPIRWAQSEPSSLGMDSEVALIWNAPSEYRPTITLSRFPSASTSDTRLIAAATITDAGPDAVLLDRDEGEGFVSQSVLVLVDGLEVRLTEVVLRWTSAAREYADTCVVARLTCTPDQIDPVGPDFEGLVASLLPDVGSN